MAQQRTKPKKFRFLLRSWYNTTRVDSGAQDPNLRLLDRHDERDRVAVCVERRLVTIAYPREQVDRSSQLATGTLRSLAKFLLHDRPIQRMRQKFVAAAKVRDIVSAEREGGAAEFIPQYLDVLRHCQRRRPFVIGCRQCCVAFGGRSDLVVASTRIIADSAVSSSAYFAARGADHGSVEKISAMRGEPEHP